MGVDAVAVVLKKRKPNVEVIASLNTIRQIRKLIHLKTTLAEILCI